VLSKQLLQVCWFGQARGRDDVLEFEVSLRRLDDAFGLVYGAKRSHIAVQRLLVERAGVVAGFHVRVVEFYGVRNATLADLRQALRKPRLLPPEPPNRSLQAGTAQKLLRPLAHRAPRPTGQPFLLVFAFVFLDRSPVGLLASLLYFGTTSPPLVLRIPGGATTSGGVSRCSCARLSSIRFSNPTFIESSCRNLGIA
jgi:hypothetical protein